MAIIIKFVELKARSLLPGSHACVPVDMCAVCRAHMQPKKNTNETMNSDFLKLREVVWY